MGTLEVFTKSNGQRSAENLYVELLKRVGGAPRGHLPGGACFGVHQTMPRSELRKVFALPHRSEHAVRYNRQDTRRQRQDGRYRASRKTARVISETSDCVIGSESAGALLAAIKGFKEDFVSHIVDGRCKENFTPVPVRGKVPRKRRYPRVHSAYRRGEICGRDSFDKKG